MPQLSFLLLPLMLGFITPLTGQAPADNYPPVLERYLAEPATSPLVDFSYAGYRNGEERLNFGSLDLTVFRVRDYGAIPDDGRDDIDGIQRTVDAAALAGGGKVIFERGRYDFDVETVGEYVHVSSSNIYLMGWGEESGGTEIYDHQPSPSPVPGKPWYAGSMPSFVLFAPRKGFDHPAIFEEPSNEVGRVTASVARGGRFLPLARPTDFTIGGVYLLTQREAADTSLAYTLAAPLRKLGSRHLDVAGEGAYKFQNMVRVDSIGSEGIYLDAPLLHELNLRWQPTLWRIPGLLQNVGVVSLRVNNGWTSEFVHHKNGEHDNGFDAVKLRYVADGWVQGIVAFNTSSVVSLNSTLNCTVLYGQARGTPGHNGFIITGASTRNLMYQCRGGRSMHSFALSGAASGNVFHDCHAEESSAIDLHSGLGVSNLFDGIYGPAYAHGGNPNGLPPVMGKHQVFWNWRVGRFEPYKGKPVNILWSSAELPSPVAVGVRGRFDRPLYLLDDGRRVEIPPETPSPTSLWRWQGKRRLADRFDF